MIIQTLTVSERDVDRDVLWVQECALPVVRYGKPFPRKVTAGDKVEIYGNGRIAIRGIVG